MPILQDFYSRSTARFSEQIVEGVVLELWNNSSNSPLAPLSLDVRFLLRRKSNINNISMKTTDLDKMYRLNKKVINNLMSLLFGRCTL